MSSIKDTAARYKDLNDLLNEATSSGRPISTERLCQKLGISDRQLRTDRAFFRDVLKAPINWDKAQNGWIYEEPFAYIDRLGLTREELQQLRIALEMLTQQQGLATRFGLLSSFLEKIELETRKVATLRNRQKHIFFDPQNVYRGIAHLPFFLDAIEQDWRTEFVYQAYGQPPKNVLFEPHFLRFWEQKWYVGGQSLDPDELKFVRVYPLERITEKPSQNGFAQKKRPANPEKYWQNILGVTQPKDDKTIYEVILKFRKPQNNYFLGAPFFTPFKTLSETAEGLIVSMNLMLNKELERKLASLGDEVSPLGPPILIEKMRAFYQKAMAHL